MKICRCMLCNYVTFDPPNKERYKDAEYYMRKHLAEKHGLHFTRLVDYRKYYIITNAPDHLLKKILQDKKLKRIFIRTFKSVTSL